jgi:hypothetical protein
MVEPNKQVFENKFLRSSCTFNRDTALLFKNGSWHRPCRHVC